MVNASSEEGRVCVNGMSYYKRDDINSNSALLVNVGKEDFKSDHHLAGMEFQRKYERAFFDMGKDYRPPVQLFGDFEKGRVSDGLKGIIPSVESGYVFGDIRNNLPSGMSETITEGVHLFARKMKGFDTYGAVLTGLEARSSSPVRLLRDEKYRSSVENIYPIGEGAGYAGGIMSAAVDGIKGAISGCALTEK